MLAHVSYGVLLLTLDIHTPVDSEGVRAYEKTATMASHRKSVRADDLVKRCNDAEA